MKDGLYYKEYVKYREYYNVMQQWVLLYQKGLFLSEYLAKNGIKNIVIYGMSDIGNCVLGDIIRSGVCQCLYTLDQGNAKLYYDIKCYRLSELNKLEKPDLIIVTVPHVYEQIKNSIENLGNYNVVSITELVYNAYYDMEM